MLRLERSSRDKLINIFVRDKERFLSKPFMIAFSIAFGFHLFLLLIFHVSPFIFTGDVIFPPANVVADTALSREGTVAIIDSSSQWIKGLPQPPASSPAVGGTPAFTVTRPMAKGEDLHVDDRLFAEMEQSVYLPKFDPLKPAKPAAFSFIISGMAAAVPIVEGSPLNGAGLTDLIAAVNEDARTVFAVMVDGRTGKVIWYEPLERSGKTKLDKFAENVLAELTFAKNSAGLAASGEIEFQIRQGE